MCIVVNKQNL